METIKAGIFHISQLFPALREFGVEDRHSLFNEVKCRGGAALSQPLGFNLLADCRIRHTGHAKLDRGEEALFVPDQFWGRAAPERGPYRQAAFGSRAV